MDNTTLMMAVLIASTTLGGLTAVFMGQLAQASGQKRKRTRQVDIVALLVSFVMFLGVVVWTIIYFSNGNLLHLIGAFCLFIFQIVAFTVVFISFWLDELRRQAPANTKG